MRTRASSVAKPAKPDTGAASMEFVGAFLLRVVRHEQDGLSRACAVLAAGSEVGIDPADLLRAGEEA